MEKEVSSFNNFKTLISSMVQMLISSSLHLSHESALGKIDFPVAGIGNRIAIKN
jgi:hypothetical protein